MNRLFDFIGHMRNIYLEKRFDRLASLTFLRVEIKGWQVECDWIMRSLCAWDTDRPAAERARNASRQAIDDVVAVRQLLFSVLPEVDSAIVRVYRPNLEASLESSLGSCLETGLQKRFDLVVTGTLKKSGQAGRWIRSLATKGILCGLEFRMSEGGLEALQTETNPWQREYSHSFFGDTEISTNGGILNAG